jgi:hypothetical protein
MKRRTPFAGLDDLIAPETLGELAGEPVNSARRLPLTGGHAASGSHLLAIETNGGRGPRFVLKRVSPEWDWIMRATDDHVGREALAWTSGLLGQTLRCSQDVAWAAVRHQSPSVRAWARHELAWWSNQAKAGAQWL